MRLLKIPNSSVSLADESPGRGGYGEFIIAGNSTGIGRGRIDDENSFPRRFIKTIPLVLAI